MPTSTVNGKTILVTGGTGSFGKGFVQYLLQNTGVKKVIVFSRDELKQSEMQNSMRDDRLRFFLGDVRDLQRLQRAFRGVDIVIHAAALKQVPTLEYNPYEAVKTNVIGSQNVIDAAIDTGVERVVLISTDKAAQPVNLYGSTKLCAEKLFIHGNAYSPDQTMFSCVRYGNVIGSRGSVVEALLNSGLKKVSVTDERMTRFWITLNQAYDLVMFTLENMRGGEIFVPKLPSMRLVDLFNALAPEAEREIIGIRPGEKLHEVLVTGEEARHTVEVNNYYVILPEDRTVFDVETRYAELLGKSNAVQDDFVFTSVNNETWLAKEDILILVKNGK